MLKELKLILNKAEKKKLLVLSLGVTILSVCEAFSIGIIIPIISLFIAPEKINSSKFLQKLYVLFHANDYFSFVLILTTIAFALFLLKFIYSLIMLYQQQEFIGQIYTRLTSSALESYLKKPYAFHLMSNSAVLFKNISAEVANFVYYFINPIIIIGSEIMILVGISLLLIALYPLPMISFICSIGLIVIFINNFFKKRIKAYSQQRNVYSEQMYKFALESLGAVKEIYTYHTNYFFVKKYSGAVKRYTDAFTKFTVISGLPRYFFEVILFSFILLVLLASISLHMASAELIPMLTMIGIVALRFLPSFSRIYTNLNVFHFSQNSFGVIYGILRESGKKEDMFPRRLASSESDSKDREIRLEDITFCYETAKEPIFKNFNITIPLNHCVAIAGETGSGKSSLIDIMMGLLNASAGSLYFCGNAIDEDNIITYRQKFGYVPQNLFLLDDTILSNIAFGIAEDKIDYRHLEKAIKIAQLEPFIRNLPAGINTLVGERGIRISGGQKQRIGIARAIYRNPEIIIFDEATSALDIQTELKLYNALKDFRNGLTIIFVTHRLSLLQQADIIYLIDKGKVVTSGNPRKLLGSSSLLQCIIKKKITSEAIE